MPGINALRADHVVNGASSNSRSVIMAHVRSKFRLANAAAFTMMAVHCHQKPHFIAQQVLTTASVAFPRDYQFLNCSQIDISDVGVEAFDFFPRTPRYAPAREAIHGLQATKFCANMHRTLLTCPPALLASRVADSASAHASCATRCLASSAGVWRLRPVSRRGRAGVECR